MLIVPYLPDATVEAVEFDGITYRPPIIDAGGRVRVNAKATGAGEVKAARLLTVDPSTTRATVATPAGGKKIRIVSCAVRSGSESICSFEVYFHTGASIETNAGKEIMDAVLDLVTLPSFGLVWPDGAGPVGAVNEVVSLRTYANVAALGAAVIHYREE